ncbi:MAG TPA: WHG domain-containing protein [Pseudonocardiaceae bacterium]|nr:WHG domain-containing protein [Pseudonocardiaceae bacterium]
MASMPAKPDTRARVLEAAMRLLDTDGPDALQVRRIAAEVGSSTMTVYTHFGSMIDLRTAVIQEGLLRFATALDQVGQTDDAIADLFGQGVAYRRFALDNPHLYRMMFGVSEPKNDQQNFRDLSVGDSPSALPEGTTAFGILARVTERAAAQGRVDVPDTVAFAAQIWSAIHGYVLLEMAGFFGTEGHGLGEVLGPLTIALLVGAGDERERVEASFRDAISRLALTSL